MVRNLLRLAVFLLIANAAMRVGIVYWRYQDFKDAVKETALFGGNRTEDALKDRLMEIAEKRDVPLNRDYIKVDRYGDRVFIAVSYVDVVQPVPGYRRNWQFDIDTR